MNAYAKKVRIEGVFPFEVKFITNIAAPVPIHGGKVSIIIAFRHLHHQVVDIEPDDPHGYNFGFRLYAEGEITPILESRAFNSSTHIPANIWIQTKFVVDSRIITPHLPYILKVDFVKEHEFWFSERLQDNTAECRDLVYRIYFQNEDAFLEYREQIERLENDVRAIRNELEVTFGQFGSNVGELGAAWGEMMRFQSQVPQILNAVSAANAASRIVGDVRGTLDAETGALAKTLSEFRRELGAVWDALDALSKKVSQNHD